MTPVVRRDPYVTTQDDSSFGASVLYYDGLLSRMRHALKGGDRGGAAVGVLACDAEHAADSIAANLATSAASSRRGDVLLIETAPRAAGESRIGLSDYLAGEAGLGRCLHATDVERLSLMPAGSEPIRPSEEIDLTRMELLLAELQSNYDLIVVSLASVLESQLAAHVSARLDGVALVLDADRLKEDVVYRVKDRLDHVGAHLLGTVLRRERRDAARQEVASGQFSLSSYSRPNR